MHFDKACIFYPSFFVILFAAWPISNSYADEPIQFDVPAITQCKQLESDSASSKIIQVELPVTVLLNSHKQVELNQLLVAVYWTSGANLVSDFMPKTAMNSDVDGTISIQKSDNRNASLGLNANGGYGNIVGLNGHGQLDKVNNKSESYQLKPKQHLLAASGRIKRGTGVYFKFHTSSQTTLEGTQVLTIQFQVPRSWRAGLLRVDCQVRGEQVRSLGFDDKNLVNSREFITAVCLADDVRAFELAAEYIRVESRLLSLQRSQKPKAKNDGLFEQIGAWMGESEPEQPQIDWARQLVYGFSESVYDRLKDDLPHNMRRATGEFVTARRNLTRLNR